MVKKMFKRINDYLSYDLLVELSEEKITIQNLISQEKFEYPPHIAVYKADGSTFTSVIGRSVKSYNNAQIINPFKHDRTFIANFKLAKKVLRHGMQSISEKAKYIAPRVIMHQLEKTNGGLSDIEHHALIQLALHAGARESIVYLGAKINASTQSYNDIKLELKSHF